MVALAQSIPRPTGEEPPRPPASRVRRGPIESRDEFLLAQPRLTLPAVSPDALPRGRTRVRLAGDWGNDFGYQTGRIERANRVLFFVDGEHRSAALQADHGLGRGFTVHARLPVLWRGGGVMDGLIDTWHRITRLPDNDRPQFPRNELQVTGLDAERAAIRWTAPEGAGLGGLELGARWSSRSRTAGWTTALDGRVQVPTGAMGFDGGGVQLGAQALAARTLGSEGDVYFGLGATAIARTEDAGLRYASPRPQGFVAFEWRPWRAVSLLAQVNAAGRLVSDVEGFPGYHVVLRMGARVDVSRGWRLEGGFTEGLKPVDVTTDFGILLGLERTF
jgi:hypothetical protein